MVNQYAPGPPAAGGRRLDPSGLVSKLRGDLRVVNRLSLVTGAAITALIGSGGWVRLSESGLGCPTWPKCTANALVAPDQYHALVEFVNRCIITTVGVVIAVTVVAAFLALPRRRDLRWLSLGLVGGYLGEAVLGGITVLLKLAPALVACHLVLAMLVLVDALVLHWRSNPKLKSMPSTVDRHVTWLSNLLLLVVAVGIAAGTVVTGSGPHSGAPGTPRFQLPFRATAEFHAIVGMFLFGLVVALFLALRAMDVPAVVWRRAGAAAALIALQGALGYATYFSHVEVDVAEAHILGAALVVVALTRLRLGLRRAPATVPLGPLPAGVGVEEPPSGHAGADDLPVPGRPARL